jgi:D-arabinose 1-dehydrogenase-like Zn-dependent alcohol dehydrogenase
VFGKTKNKKKKNKHKNKNSAHVTVYSTSPNKEVEAKSFGAHRFVNLKDEAQMKQEEQTQEIIVNCATEPLDWSVWLGKGWPAGVLKNTGKFIMLGIPNGTLVHF